MLKLVPSFVLASFRPSIYLSGRVLLQLTGVTGEPRLCLGSSLAVASLDV